MSNDGFKWNAYARIDKYSPEVVRELTQYLGYEPKSADFKRLSVDANSITEVDGNILVTGGLGNLTNLFFGGGGDAFSNAKAIVGVGDSSTAAAAAQTDLQASTNKYFQGVDASNPTRVTTTVTNDAVQAIATFASGNANFAWNEWCWAVTTTGTITGNATLASVSSGTETMLNRKVASMGTKGSGSSWVFTTKVTFS